MPEDCLTKRCFDCQSHAVVKGKLDCNYMNRLGLAEPAVKNFLEDTTPLEKSPEELDAELKQMEEQQKLVAERIAALKKKQEVGGDLSGTTST